MHRWRTPCSPRRPALACALAFVTGACACHSGETVPWIVAAALAMLTAIFLVRLQLASLATLLAIACLGWVRTYETQAPHSPSHISLHQDSGGQIILYGRTQGEAAVRPDEVRWKFDVDSVAYPDSVAPRTGRVLARFRFDPGILPDSRVKLAGRLVRPGPARFPGGFSWSDYLRRNGLHGLFEPAQGSPVLSVTSEGRGFLRDVVAPLRQLLNARLGSHLEGDAKALASGLLLGEREQISPETTDAFRRTGTLHLLAVSGSNVGVVALAVWGVLLFLRVPRPLRLLGSGVCIVLFCFLAHLEASVVRAGLAALLVLGGQALRRRVDPIQVWGLVLLVFAAWDPASLLDLGFQLSFAATLGILLLPDGPNSTPASRFSRLLRLVLISVLVSSAAQLATLPFLLAVFGEVPLVTPLSNLLCVPLAGLATLAATLVLFLAPLGEPLLGATTAVLWVCVKSLLAAVHGTAQLGVPIPSLPVPGAWALSLLAALVLSLFAFVNRPGHRRRLVFGATSVLCLTVFLARGNTHPEVVVLDGPGPAALVRLSTLETWLVAHPSDPPAKVITRAAQGLGWSVPSGAIHLQDSVEAGAGTLIKSSSYVLGDTPVSEHPELTVLCSHDSLPIAVVVQHEGRQIVLCGTWPARSPDGFLTSPGAIWVTDREWPSTFRGASQGDQLVYTGRKPAADLPAGVQILHTSRLGSIRIYWQDGRFQTEPSIR